MGGNNGSQWGVPHFAIHSGRCNTYKMSYFKTLNKVLLPLLVLVNLHLSLDCKICQESTSIGYNIELILSEIQNDNEISHFSYVQQYSLSKKSIQHHNKKSTFEFKIQNTNLLDKLNFHNQENIALNLKPILFPIILKEITNQKISLYLI
ncbi:hypothetical protein GCM10011368_11070 [Hyunsoonleella pacifica]|nr:hypothetical protein GCM10011368_11070 [Hyunsoonleella pacifica]